MLFSVLVTSLTFAKQVMTLLEECCLLIFYDANLAQVESLLPDLFLFLLRHPVVKLLVRVQLSLH
jgi:hypothetical protein